MERQEQLESILAESVASARERERQAFDQLAGPCTRSMVLYGAGNLGRKMLRGLRQHNLEPIAFADANPILDGKQVEGVPVFSPEEAVRRFGKEAVFVVCVWHPDRQRGMQDIIDRLSGMGAERGTSFVPLFWKYAEIFLPYFFWELPSRLVAQAARIRRCCEVLNNESHQLLVSQLRMRTNADFRDSGELAPLPAYFPSDLFRLKVDECFVDCGAFDGDTIREFLVQSEASFRHIIAFEPDPYNFDKLFNTLKGDARASGRAKVFKAALGESAGTVRFAATGSDDASVRADGEVEVECRTLDEAAGDAKPTFIKMDIEGSERAALTGGRQTIISGKPILAVSVYHKPCDLWELPLFMRELEPESQLSLRMYWRDGMDLVCFAVPPGRNAGSRSSIR
jgi:FkbM family methyltransferase